MIFQIFPRLLNLSREKEANISREFKQQCNIDAYLNVSYLVVYDNEMDSIYKAEEFHSDSFKPYFPH